MSVRADLGRRLLGVPACFLALSTAGASATPHIVGSQAQLQLTVQELPKAKARSSTPSVAKFEPERGCYLGAYIELDPKLTSVYIDSNKRERKLPEEFEAIVEKPHAMYFFYQGYGTPLPRDWVKMLVDRNKLVHIAFEPNGGLDEVQDDRYLQNFADELKDSGAKVFLRFASEMNGDWTHYGGNPTKYKQKFRLVAEVMRERAPNVAMVWCPYTTPQKTIPSYYPGDEWVDWVGVNMYNVTYFNQDKSKPAHDIEPEDMLKFVYDRYAQRKPMMICEYGTTNFSRLENRPLPEFARSNILALYGSLRKRYPRVKAVNYFNSNNLLIHHAANNNYAVTAIPSVLQAYQSAIRPDYFLSQPLPDPEPEPAPPAKPVEPGGEAVRTPKRIVATLKDAPPNCFVRFLVDKQVASCRMVDGNFQTEIDPRKLEPGTHEILAEALDPSGKTVAVGSIVLKTAR